MHKSIDELRHEHRYHGGNRGAERKVALVVGLTAVTMVAEIAFGTLFGSMALVADGWHMGTHTLALGLTFAAYTLSRRFMRDTRFSFGTWKIEVLGGYTSALLLGVAGVSMIVASVERLWNPVPIRYDEALVVAIIGLAVNVASIFILGRGNVVPAHAHHNNHRDAISNRPHSDLNMRAAYLHVVTDALTSVLAIGALFAAKYRSWDFVDPLAGILGAVLILKWTTGLLRETGGILLDREATTTLNTEVRNCIEADGVSRVSDLHLWRIAHDRYACIIVLATPFDGFTIADFKDRLRDRNEIVHVSVELHYIES